MVQGQPIIEVSLDGIETRKHTRFTDKQLGALKLPVYTGDDDISGVVEVKMNKQKKIEHMGIRIELVGRIEIINDQKQSSDFMSMSRELEPQGILFEEQSLQILILESYYGNTVRLRYYLKIYMTRSYGKVQKEVDFAVLISQPELEEQPQTSLKLEVGIEECLHIDFEYFKSKYHLRDVVTGKVNFYLVKIKIKYMELAVIRKEQYGQGQQQQTDNETLVKYELMDGCPQKGEVIPIRLYLSGVDITPSVKNVNGKFSVKYILNLILVDEDDRRYFKQQEITIYRKK
ncbi:unnamed protein product (macronuclear) [Paramecium tetraurelia]|uniref:Vacuolar protein sorting-associated protein 26 n=1 Tax=Paramecium tetraurelia TaxID=5888 RepID=A0ED50_PARTE|nr:uncharacterized protein GSPATT00004086001 [Paramecium tetraurelia]CAK93217.1 unnamed protein product [Paramecium tetraurelia]|eukprot:XP_001460614.1 hypothetical protein (macronuclear) [Paramecium tetraurelia strain d4-2]